MGTQRIEGGEFSLIITEADKARLESAAKEFAATFSLDEAIAAQIVKSAPIIFAQKLTKGEVKAITPKLVELSKSGLEFRVTARVAQKLPKVNWPIRPQFTVGGSGGPNGLAFEWNNNAFVCPGCGETFLFRRLGKLRLVEPAPEAKPAPSPLPAPKPSPAGLTELAEGRMEGIEGGEPVLEPEPIELPEAIEEIPLEMEPVADLSPAAQIQPPDETAAPEAEGEFSTAVEEIAPAPEPVVEPAGELFNVFLSKITESAKRDKAAELIAKIKGCSQQEAKELTTRLVIPLAKGVAKEQAEEILNQFKKLKIFGRMTKVK